LAWVRSLRALRLATISARIASTAPSRPLGAPDARPDCAARAALTASSGPGLAVAAAVLPAGPDCLHHPDAGRGQVPGQARAVAAGAPGAGQADDPEPAQPAGQIAVPGRGGRELPDAEQPANRVQCGGHVSVRAGDPRRR
jgi:hypothetical protein